MSTDNFQQACAESELAQGQMRCVTLGGSAVLLCHTRDGVHAVENMSRTRMRGSTKAACAGTG